ncbi:MAG: sodium-translocating pyrophosphatase, partial [Gammaproteobacteria bacterium]|nr:sodium-translocating pyrophosphatase [Gammaproteobacteria bacterium]
MILDALLPPLFGIAGLVVAFVIYTIMVRQSEGDEKIRKIGDAIHEGAMVFMNTEYSRLAMFAIPLGIILYFALGINTAISFAVGALASGLAGYLGMFSAT